MPKKKTPFIDKNKSLTFAVVHRSQRDPLVTDENAPQFVLKEIVKRNTYQKNRPKPQLKIVNDETYSYTKALKDLQGENEVVQTARKVEEKETKEPAIQLLSSVFPSDVEEKIGVLNKAAPTGLRLDLDPDVIAALDDDFKYSDSENELEDDFVQMANASGSESDYKCSDDDFFYDEDEDEEEARDLLLDLEETRSRFTNYSMSSSVIRRNEHLSLLDERFEALYAEYDDPEIGALDNEENMLGILDDDSKLVERVVDQFSEYDSKEQYKPEKTTAVNYESDDSLYDLVEVKEKEEWDCESCLTNNSSLYNHPKLIITPSMSRIKISAKTGIPITSNRLTAAALAKHDGERSVKATGPGSLVSMVSALSIRPKNESPQDRLDRKKALKSFRKERRVEKKVNKLAFKQEKSVMHKCMINNKTRFQIPL